MSSEPITDALREFVRWVEHENASDRSWLLTVYEDAKAALALPAPTGEGRVYLPMLCTNCDRVRVEWDGKTMECEKCGQASTDEMYFNDPDHLTHTGQRGEVRDALKTVADFLRTMAASGMWRRDPTPTNAHHWSAEEWSEWWYRATEDNRDGASEAEKALDAARAALTSTGQQSGEPNMISYAIEQLEAIEEDAANVVKAAGGFNEGDEAKTHPTLIALLDGFATVARQTIHALAPTGQAPAPSSGDGDRGGEQATTPTEESVASLAPEQIAELLGIVKGCVEGYYLKRRMREALDPERKLTTRQLYKVAGGVISAFEGLATCCVTLGKEGHSCDAHLAMADVVAATRYARDTQPSGDPERSERPSQSSPPAEQEGEGFKCPHCGHTATFHRLGDVTSCGRCGLHPNHAPGCTPAGCDTSGKLSHHGLRQPPPPALPQDDSRWNPLGQARPQE